MVLCGAVLPLTAQQQPSTSPATPDPASLRAAEDLRRIAASIAAAQPTFAGSCTALPRPPGWSGPTVTFTQSHRDGLEWLRLSNHTVVTCGNRQLVSAPDGTWRPPEGDSPEPLLQPVQLLALTADGVVVRSEASSHGDRPAQRVLVRWTGPAARRVIETLWVPSPRPQGHLEQLTRLVERADHATRVVVDCAICYDPARRQLWTCNLRVAVVDPDQEAHPEAPDPPLGLPLLPQLLMAQYCFALEWIEAPPTPWPALPDADRARLQPTTKR